MTLSEDHHSDCLGAVAAVVQGIARTGGLAQIHWRTAVLPPGHTPEQLVLSLKGPRGQMLWPGLQRQQGTSCPETQCYPSGVRPLRHGATSVKHADTSAAWACAQHMGLMYVRVCVHLM